MIANIIPEIINILTTIHFGPVQSLCPPIAYIRIEKNTKNIVPIIYHIITLSFLVRRLRFELRRIRIKSPVLYLISFRRNGLIKMLSERKTIAFDTSRRPILFYNWN